MQTFKLSGIYPESWTKTDENFCLVQVQVTSPEYEFVFQDFRNKMKDIQFYNFKVIHLHLKISSNNFKFYIQLERIQNKALFQLYDGFKNQLKQKYKGKNVNEMYLFHGTDPENIKKIQESNFNRNFRGKNGRLKIIFKFSKI